MAQKRYVFLIFRLDDSLVFLFSVCLEEANSGVSKDVFLMFEVHHPVCRLGVRKRERSVESLAASAVFKSVEASPAQVYKVI